MDDKSVNPVFSDISVNDKELFINLHTSSILRLFIQVLKLTL